jgi:hypothetical protein
MTAFMPAFAAEPEQLRRTPARLLAHRSGGLDYTGPLDIAPEVLLVEARPEDRFRRPLQIEQREHWRYEIDRDWPDPETGPEPSYGGSEDLKMVLSHCSRRRSLHLSANLDLMWVEGLYDRAALKRLHFVPGRPVKAKSRADAPCLPIERMLTQERRRLELPKQRLSDTFMTREAAIPSAILPWHEIEAAPPYAAGGGRTLLGRNKPQETD